MLELEGKVAIVTGGSRGIGRAIAERLAQAGAAVLTCSRRAPEGPALPWVAADVRELADIERVIAEARARHGRLDILVNNAGGSPPVQAATASPRFSAAVIALNLVAPLHFAQRANAVMQEQPEGGVILNVASTSGTRASPGTAAYGAAKAGLLNLTASLAAEWAPRVRVNAVTPGAVATEGASREHGGLVGVVSPRDVADACLYLVSPLARHVSGASLLVHAGAAGA
jgi:NAD(P)-dependent dehydrogenase (short-subunit alcohol dehydrogenase family)